MANLNRVSLIGRLTKEPELKNLPSGVAVCNFSIAVNEKYKDKSGQYQEKTEFINISSFSKTAELCNQYLKKGSMAYLEGKIQTRSWEDKEGNKQYSTEVLVSQVQFLDSKGSDSKPQGNNFSSDDVPF